MEVHTGEKRNESQKMQDRYTCINGMEDSGMIRMPGVEVAKVNEFKCGVNCSK